MKTVKKKIKFLLLPKIFNKKLYWLKHYEFVYERYRGYKYYDGIGSVVVNDIKLIDIKEIDG